MDERYINSAEEFKKLVEKKQYDINDIIWRYLALLNADREKEAYDFLNNIEMANYHSEFETNLLKYFSNKGEETNIYKLNLNKDEKCRAFFYIGTWHFIKGDNEEGKKLFTKIVEMDLLWLPEYRAAKMKLEDLKN